MEVGPIYRIYPDYNFKSVSVNRIARKSLQVENNFSWNKNIDLLIAYIAIAVLWFSLGDTLSSSLQWEASLLYWSGWTIVFGWSAGIIFFAALSIFHSKGK